MFMAVFEQAMVGEMVLSPMELWQHHVRSGYTQLSYAEWSVQRAVMLQFTQSSNSLRMRTHAAPEREVMAALVDLPAIEDEQRRAAVAQRKMEVAQKPPLSRKRKQAGSECAFEMFGFGEI